MVKLLTSLARESGMIADANFRQDLMKLHTLHEVGRMLTMRVKAEKAAGRDIVAAPNIGTLTDGAGAPIDRYAYGLVPVALTEWLGYAWVCLSDTPPPFEDVMTWYVSGYRNPSRLAPSGSLSHS